MIRARLQQAIGFVEFFSSLGAAAVITWVVWKLAVEPMGWLGDNAQLPAVQRSVQWTDTLLTNLPVIFAIIAVVGSLAFVVFQTRFT